MEIITPFEIYCIAQVDTICFGLSVVSVIMLSIALIVSVIADSSMDEEKLYKLARRCLYAAVAMVVVLSFVPSSRTLAMMKILPAIANNEKVQDEASELYKLAKEGLEKLTKGDKPDE